MSKQDFIKMPSCVLKVNIHCDGCKNKVRKILQKIDGVYSISIDAEQGKVTVLGNVDPLTLLMGLEKAGKHAEPWGGQKVTSNMMNNLNLFQNMQMPNHGKTNKSQKGAKDQHKNVKKMKGHEDLNFPQKPAKFNMPLNDDEFYDDSEFDDDDDGEFEDGSFEGHHHHKNSVNIKMKPFMCNGHGTHGSNKGGHGKKGGPKAKGKSGGKKNDGKNNRGGKEKGMFKLTSSFRGLLRKFDKKKCCNESKKGRCDGGKVSNKGGTIKNVGKNGGKDSAGLKGGVKKNKNGGLKGGVKSNGRGKKKGGSNGGGDGEGGHSLGSWDHMIDNEAINDNSFNKSRKGHNGGSGGRSVGHMEDFPMNQMGGDHLGRSNPMGQMGNNGNVMSQLGLDQMGQMRNNIQRGQMGIDQMGQMGNGIQIRQMGQNMMEQMGGNPMGNIPAVHGLPAGPGGYYQNLGQGWNQYTQQQQQYLAAMMMNQQQQQVLQGSGMYHPAMQGRPQPAAMSYGPPIPPPVTINITEYFSDENPNNCSIM